MTHDTQEGMNIVAKFQPYCSNGLGVMMFRRFGGKASVTDFINGGGVC